MDKNDFLCYDFIGDCMEVIKIGRSNKLIFENALHKHDNTEIIYNLSGTGVMTFSNGESQTFKENSIVVIPAGVYHSKHSKCGFQDMWVEFSGSMYSYEYPIIIDSLECKKVKNIFEMCLEWYAQNNSLLNPLLNSGVDLINELIHHIHKREYDAEIEQILHDINVGFANPEFSVTSTIKNTGYCLDHIRRKFKKQVGMTPSEYLNRTRLEYAKRLLESSNMVYTIGEISYFSGFYDQHYFSRLFKKYFGCTPKQINKKV